MAPPDRYVIPTERLELVHGFGLSSHAVAYVYRPANRDGILEAFDAARRSGRTVAFRGAGRSYGDAALNGENILIDTSRLNRVLAWNPADGVITVEPGVTIQKLWETVIPDGWWPAVVPGTMFPTIGGCLAMNVHGKNNFRVGPIGDHVESFDFMVPAGMELRCSRDENADLFHAVIGGFGMLGCFTSVTLRMKKIYSGLLDVVGVSTPNLQGTIDEFDNRRQHADYLVGWIDALSDGSALGRGVVHQATFLDQGIDPAPEESLRVEHQVLPRTLFGFVPKSAIWRLLRPLMNNTGVRAINTVRYFTGRYFDGQDGRTFRQPHAAFSFLLDYIPDWRKAYGKGGMIQYQSFVPNDASRDVFTEQIRLARRYGIPSYLAVFKRHRPDRFLISHGVDGYSLAMDFKVTDHRKGALWRMAREFNGMVLESGGRFYLAKDSTLTRDAARQYLGPEVMRRFRSLRAKCDPDGMLRSDLFNRLFA